MMKESTRQREIELISERKRLEEELRMNEILRSKRKDSEIE